MIMMKRPYQSLFWLLNIFILCACSQRTNLAPVVELHWKETEVNAIQHRVLRGETLYAIAFRYDQDYRQLALINHLSSPYTVKVGQMLRLQSTPVAALPVQTEPMRVQTSHTVYYRTSIPHASPRSAPKPTNNAWIWPAQGKVVATYSPQQGKKGIDIAGRKGEKIHATRGGIVAYSGNGLGGYGNLIIIKHDNQYLTAYGNNSRNLVREGQRIRAGQEIAEMGLVDRRYWGLHFEIRKTGIPVNPLNYLGRSG